MSEKMYTVYYNAVMTAEGAHLLAVGWCNESGWRAVLGEVEGSGPPRYRFTLEEDGEAHLPVLTPFETALGMTDPPKSVMVEDDFGNVYQVQVYGMMPAGSGGNTPAEWVEG
jgi:hypothetical protein